MIYAICIYLGIAIGYAISTSLTQLQEMDRCDAIRGERSGPIIRALTILCSSLTWPVPAYTTIALLIEIRRNRS